MIPQYARIYNSRNYNGVLNPLSKNIMFFETEIAVK